MFQKINLIQKPFYISKYNFILAKLYIRKKIAPKENISQL